MVEKRLTAFILSVVPATQETKAGRLLDPRISKPGWAA